MTNAMMGISQYATLASLLEIDDPRGRLHDAIPVAADLACAIDDHDKGRVSAVLATLEKADLHALVVLLAALVDVDEPLTMVRHGCDRFVQLAALQAARIYGVTTGEIFHTNGKRGAVNVAHARHVVVLVADRAGFRQADIARAMHVDHSTVLYALENARHRPRVMAAAEIVSRHMGLEGVGAA